MRKFIRLSILFLSPIIIIMIAMEFALRSIPNDYSYKCKYLKKNSNQIQVLILGTSHTYRGINPNLISGNCFNAAEVSQSINFDLAIFEKYKGNWKSLKFIVIPVDYFTLFSSLKNGIEKWRVKNYRIYYDINKYNDGNFWDRFELFSSKLGVNYYRIKKYIENGKTDLYCRKLGFAPRGWQAKKLNFELDGEKAAKRHTFKINNAPYFQRNLNILKTFIHYSKQDNFKILFITCPAYKTYVKNLKPKQLQITLKTIKKLVANNPNTKYVNFLTDSSFTANDFYNADHLNNSGAKKFSLKIDSVLLKMSSPYIIK